MSHTLLPDTSFYLFLLKNDKDTALEIKAVSCPFCSGPLDHASYERKPRNTPAGLPDEFNTVFSLCCRRDGCRKRITPPSLRFFGRRVYLLFIMIKSCADCGRNPSGLIATKARLWGMSRQALKRWYEFWQNTFSLSGFWRFSKGLLPINSGDLPLPEHLLQSFRCLFFAPEHWLKLLQFLSPYHQKN